MGCHRCGQRQVDPARGPSPWKRGVLGGRQVLVCPTCQRDSDWQRELDSCAGCASTALVRRLDEVICRACGATAPAVELATGLRRTPDQDPLEAEVAAALDRLFGRG